MGIISNFLALFGGKKDHASRSNILISKLIRIDELENQLTLLLDGQTEYDFFGITSNGVDCIYFVRDEDKIQIEFEAMVTEQLPFINSLKEFAESINVASIDTNYGNIPRYDSNEPAPVIRLEINADVLKASELGRQIQWTIFKNNEGATYDVVP